MRWSPVMHAFGSSPLDGISPLENDFSLAPSLSRVLKAVSCFLRTLLKGSLLMARQLTLSVILELNAYFESSLLGCLYL